MCNGYFVLQNFYICILLTLFRYRYAKQAGEKWMQEKKIDFYGKLLNPSAGIGRQS